MSFLTHLLPFPSHQPAAPRPRIPKSRIFYNPPDADPDYDPTLTDSDDSEVDDLLALFPRPSLTRPPPPMRLALTPTPHVYGFPPSPSGGVLLLTAPAPADLEFLGLPAIPAEEIPPPLPPPLPPLEEGREKEEEEAFCERMRLLGAQWWKEGEAEMCRAKTLRGRYRLDADGLDIGGLRTVRLVAVGFEEAAGAAGGAEGGSGGGVWVYRERWGQREEAKFRRRNERWREDEEIGRDAVDHEARRRGRHARRRERREEERRIARVAAARTMEERCRVIRECEGEYFESVEAWRKVVMEEHVREGVLAPDRDRLFRKTSEDGFFL